MEKIKCSQDNPCQDCQEEQKKQLAKTEDWEVKRKEKLEKFEFMEAEFCNNRRSDGNKIQYSSFGNSINVNWEKCPSCQEVVKTIKSNSYGDKTEELNKHAHTSGCQVSNQIPSKSSHMQERERERERAILSPITYLGF